MNITQAGLKVLRLLSRSMGKEYYVREIAKCIDASVGICSQVLDELHSQGLVERRKSGRNLYYRINDANPGIVHFKIFLNVLELNPLIDLIKDDSIKIILFGSCAIGEDRLDSDIDALILTNGKELIRVSLKQFKLDRELKPIIVTPDEFILLKKNDPAFYKEINKGLILWQTGIEHD
jgi:predicted nucleotidyltransferase